ncbi:tetratricopeptide (TPR) repeat protein [Ereboglobus sp. PH5-10]|uniref:SWIM zinc finger family protein n=1 Tax=Ereboglobus sp. PH5-10 TaxID=2940629 RepID=UPI002406A7AD|nr:SWIM zinc finger family protein [Ereboglobus sp. PH5-10]MDF9828224.1 tetratricopeptide (TPR) repeat protein [Ereboglobus sp. PH5-10]
MPPASLTDLLTIDGIKKLASPRSFMRGVIYHASGLVASLTQHDNTLTAIVRGTENYTVCFSVSISNDTSAPALDYHCTCPHASGEGVFCKHCVAVALAWLKSGKGNLLNEAPAVAGTPAGNKSTVIKLDDLRPWLLSLPKEKLAGTLLETAARDCRLHEQLLRHAALATGKQPDFNACRAVIRHATTIHDPTSELQEFADILERFSSDGYHNAVLELSEYALERINTRIADSDGDAGFVCRRLLDIHHEATRRANTPPAQLARLIHAWTFVDNYYYFSGVIERYADLLGEAGLAALRASLNAELSTFTSVDVTHTAVEALRTIARLTNDTEALVALETRDLAHPSAYLRAAEIYHEANQHDKALEWARRGIARFPENTTGTEPLVDFIIAEYHRRRQHDKALALAWKCYEASPSRGFYQRLKESVHAAGENWRQWSERALATLRATLDTAIANQTINQKYPPWTPRLSPFANIFFVSLPLTDYSTLVRVLLWENNTDAAWAAANEKGCDETLWFELAGKRADKHPADAIPIYMRRIKRLIEQHSDSAREEAALTLRKIKELHASSGQDANWENTRQTLRQTFRKNDDFIKLLDTL